jgi:hypothetical protein
MIFHFRDRRDKFGFVFRGQTTAKRADVDSRTFGIVVRRDVNFDVSGVGDGLASGESGTTNEDDNGDKIELHFSLTNRKLNERGLARKWQRVIKTTGVFSLGI